MKLRKSSKKLRGKKSREDGVGEYSGGHMKSISWWEENWSDACDGKTNQSRITEFFNVKVIGDSSKNLFSGVVEAVTWLEIVQDRRG